VTTKGNPHCHIILRGGDNGPNYDVASVSIAREELIKADQPASIMIDASHANCSKDHKIMPSVFREIVRQKAEGDHTITGAMLESNIESGNQAFPQPKDELVYGKSITDKCIDWDTTVTLVREAAEQLRAAKA